MQTKFELRIRLADASSSFVLTKVKSATTVFEIKQAVEKLKGFKMETQSITYKQEKMLDLRSLTSYGVFERQTAGDAAGIALLILEVSNRPIMLRVSLAHMKLGNTGGSQTAEDDLEVKCFTTCSVYCLKVIL